MRRLRCCLFLPSPWHLFLIEVAWIGGYFRSAERRGSRRRRAASITCSKCMACDCKRLLDKSNPQRVMVLTITARSFANATNTWKVNLRLSNPLSALGKSATHDPRCRL